MTYMTEGQITLRNEEHHETSGNEAVRDSRHYKKSEHSKHRSQILKFVWWLAGMLQRYSSVNSSLEFNKIQKKHVA